MRQELRSLVTIKREHLMNLRFNLALFDHPNEIHKVLRAIGFDGEPHLAGAQRVQEGGHDLPQSEIQRPETPDRKSVVSGKSVALGGRRILKKKKPRHK